MKPCAYCGGTTFGLVRYYWGFHQFCKHECLRRYKQLHQRQKAWLAWLYGDP